MAKMPGLRSTQDKNGDGSIVTALIPDASGNPICALGIVLPEDTRRWQARQAGATVLLDQQRLAAFRKLIQALDDQGKKWWQGFKRQIKADADAGKPMEEWPDWEDTLQDSQFTATAWGSISYTLQGDAEEYEPGTSERGMRTWYLSLGIDRNVRAILTPAHIAKLIKHLDATIADFSKAYGSRTWFGDNR